MNLKRNNQDIIKMHDLYNSKPFNINSLVPSNDSRLLANEYKFYVLSLNEYLTTHEITISQDEIFQKIEEWVYNRTKKKNEYSHTKVVNSARELIFICGFWASQVLLSLEQKQLIIEVVSKERDLAINQLKNIEIAVKKVAGLIEDTSHIDLLTAWKNYLDLSLDYLKFLHTNNGKPAIIYFIIQLKSLEILELTKIPKTEILIFLTELFYSFKFINKRERLSFPDNLYRNLNRIAKLEAIDNLKALANRLLNI